MPIHGIINIVIQILQQNSFKNRFVSLLPQSNFIYRYKLATLVRQYLM